MRRLPQKTSVGNQEIKFSIVQNSPKANKKSNYAIPPQQLSSPQRLTITKLSQPPAPQRQSAVPVANSQSLSRPPQRPSVGLSKQNESTFSTIGKPSD